ERISFNELMEIARQKTAPFLGPDPSGTRAAEEEAIVSRNLLQLYTRGLVDIFTAPVPVTRSVPDKPQVTPLARYQALNARLVTSRAHAGLKFDAAGRLVISVCDGTRDHASIANSLMDAVKSGKLRVAENGQPVEGEARLREVLTSLTEGHLKAIAMHGFLTEREPSESAKIPSSATTTQLRVEEQPVAQPASTS
ncbi:MAG TPA: hypothetical protein VEA63_04775, partial [Opitutus sp.]|nr:hypothetical protein [Opitutus sp.]